MTIFAQPTKDENLTPGWNVQSGGPGAGYGSTEAAHGAASGTGQAGAGYPNPAQAEDIGGEASASYTQSILTNPGYANGGAIVGQTVTSPAVVSTGTVTNPFGMAAIVTLSVPSTVTSIKVNGATAWDNAATPVAASVALPVPPGGTVETVGANATTTSWTSSL